MHLAAGLAHTPDLRAWLPLSSSSYQLVLLLKEVLLCTLDGLGSGGDAQASLKQTRPTLGHLFTTDESLNRLEGCLARSIDEGCSQSKA